MISLLFFVVLICCLGHVTMAQQPPPPPPDGGGGGTTEYACEGCVDLLSCSTAADDVLCAEWMFNEGAHVAPNIADAVTDIAQIDIVQDGDVELVRVITSGVPSYAPVITQDHIDALNSRPNAETDFTTGVTTLAVGDTVEFGDNIGYVGTSPGCELGFWPPGPGCPEDVAKTYYFPHNPVQASGDECFTQLGASGLFVNGVSAYDWSDGASYNSAGVWNNIAQWWEAYDMDICVGHAANGDYHHHNPPPCLKEELGDMGTGHSPIYGFAADGFPIYGEYQAADTLAQSCWKTRDYEDVNSATGCGEAKKRTCLLVDQYDISKGTVAASSSGPDTDFDENSQSGNPFVTVSGFYFEDYYFDWDCHNAGGLDHHNGHDHDGLGWHYHITDAFPYFFGPTLYGEVDGSSFLNCADTQAKKLDPNPSVESSSSSSSSSSSVSSSSSSSVSSSSPSVSSSSSSAHSSSSSSSSSSSTGSSSILVDPNPSTDIATSTSSEPVPDESDSSTSAFSSYTSAYSSFMPPNFEDDDPQDIAASALDYTIALMIAGVITLFQVF